MDFFIVIKLKIGGKENEKIHSFVVLSFLALTIANNNFNTKDESVHCYFTNSNGDNNEVLE